jgi:transketolase
MPMGCADFAFMLWYKYMRHNPRNPQWIGRDRFCLSAGHGSMLLYSLLHLFEYGLTIEDLKNFRQWGSLTPGHPEHGHTAGVEVTAGPLGSAFASGVGMAMAARSFAARSGLAAAGELLDPTIWVMCGDGCMMEGTTHEAASLAGHLKLDNIVCFYDDNHITIEGSTDLAFSEDVGKRYAAYGWRVIRLANANDLAQVDAALRKTRKRDGRPTLIIGRTTIGYGAPHLAGDHECHGAPLGAEELAATKAALGMGDQPPFHVAPEIRTKLASRVKKLAKSVAVWDRAFQAAVDADPVAAARISQLLQREIPANLLDELKAVAPVAKPDATRSSGGAILQKVAELVPALIGGAADLAPSTKTLVKGGGDFSAANPAGRNLHFGVRELGMSLIANGMALYGTALPYVSTFFVFCDYMKPGIRLAAIQKLPVVYVFTHDSFFVGEDGPTHEPVEQMAMLRSQPGLSVIRPAEANEVAHAWAAALQDGGPVALLLTRQNLPPLSPEQAARIDLRRGAYVLDDQAGFDLILIATGSEVQLALDSAKVLREKGRRVRVVSMPCQEYFLRQDAAYRESILPSACRKRVSIEAGTTFGWHRFVGLDGLSLGLDDFGASAPYKVLAEKFGFTVGSVVARVEAQFPG